MYLTESPQTWQVSCPTGPGVIVRCLIPTQRRRPLDEHGRMYAGEILKLVDIVAGVASRRHAETGCVTITLDRFILVQEVKVGDLLHLSASVNRAWNTSMGRR